jgi:hypothetical protein
MLHTFVPAACAFVTQYWLADLHLNLLGWHVLRFHAEPTF